MCQSIDTLSQENDMALVKELTTLVKELTSQNFDQKEKSLVLGHVGFLTKGVIFLTP